LEIKDNGQDDTEVEAERNEDVDDSLELHVEVDVNANGHLDDGMDRGNDGSNNFEVDVHVDTDIEDADDSNSGLDFRDDVSKQGDVETGNNIEAQSGEDVNFNVNESEDIDGQGLDDDDDLGVQVDIHGDGHLGFNGSLNLNQDRVNTSVGQSEAVGNGLRRGAHVEDRRSHGLRSTSKHLYSRFSDALGEVCAISGDGRERRSEGSGGSEKPNEGFETEHGLRC